ncbi:hypothetical protein CECT5772_01528 [Streptococcus equi subsp. ruminatorum CECT 5772]|uniref:Uncharacterized protein n=1 Tax=Streptococcus equi subsp. ruminatorum CECT 5772 TaxID=1051981 RepID=A0A922NVU9_9STRE|nr:hypothetical protein CECT5772_01528 [Streptococcus equi subsp. ruminatorum CECT 5772]
MELSWLAIRTIKHITFIKKYGFELSFESDFGKLRV